MKTTIINLVCSTLIRFGNTATRLSALLAVIFGLQLAALAFLGMLALADSADAQPWGEILSTPAATRFFIAVAIVMLLPAVLNRMIPWLQGMAEA